MVFLNVVFFLAFSLEEILCLSSVGRHLLRVDSQSNPYQGPIPNLLSDQKF